MTTTDDRRDVGITVVVVVGPVGVGADTMMAVCVAVLGVSAGSLLARVVLASGDSVLSDGSDGTSGGCSDVFVSCCGLRRGTCCGSEWMRVCVSTGSVVVVLDLLSDHRYGQSK